MKKAISFTLGFTALVFLMTVISGCYMFKKKNRCGDCPKWKIELIRNLIE